MSKLLALTLAGSLFTAAPALAHEAHDVEAALEAYSGALAAEDVTEAEAWVLADDEDFTIFEGSGTNIGWADYRDHHLAPEFAAEGFEIDVYDWHGYNIEIDGDLAVATFTIRMEYVSHGEARVRDAHGTAILTRTESGWRLRHLHTS
jgi:ketosteroid isomerase-like protein